MTAVIPRSRLARAVRAGRAIGPPPGSAVPQRPVVSAMDVAAVCIAGGPSAPSGLRVRGVWVRGRLDLAHAEVPFPVSFDDCVFDEPVCLHGAHLPALTLEACELPALEANGIHIDHDLVLSGSVVALSGAEHGERVRAGGGLVV